MPRPIKYLNTDLELESAHDLSLIVKKLHAEGCVILYDGKLDELNFATFEVSLQSTNPDDTVGKFVKHIDSLPAEARTAFDNCCSRVVDIAFESGDEPSSFSSVLALGTIIELSRLGISVSITIYPPSEY